LNSGRGRAHAAISLGALTAIPLLVLVDSAIGYLRGWRISYTIEKAIIASAAAWIVAALLLMLMGRVRRVLRDYWSQMLVMMLSLAVCVGLAETIVRMLPFGREAPFHLREPHLTRIFQPDAKILPGTSPRSRFTTNAQGVRGPEMPPRHDATRYLCIGGSTTECAYVDDDLTWTHLLMVELNAAGVRPPAWSGSAGMSGYESAAHVAFIRMSPLVQEMDAIVLLAGVNDLQGAIAGGGGGEVPRPELLGRPLWRRSQLLIRAGVILRRHAMRDERSEDEYAHSYIPRRQRRQNSVIVDQLPDLGAGREKFIANVLAIAWECRAHNIRLIVLTQPVLWDEHLDAEQKSLLWFGWMKDGRYLSAAALRRAMDQYNLALLQACRENNIECVDLSTMNGDARYFMDDCHFSVAGAAEVSRLLTQAILKTRTTLSP
jgi:hypothetical protein